MRARRAFRCDSNQRRRMFPFRASLDPREMALLRHDVFVGEILWGESLG